ncbi:MAG: hypothetical protein ABII96_06735 [Candidatus Zixiibacteriota bacterium]
MADTTSYAKLVGGWTLTISPLFYLFYCIILALLVRVFHSYIKAKSIAVGKESEENHKELRGLPFKERFWASFQGFKKSSVTDLWLGLVIGFAEIATYPVLIFTNNLSAIGGWLAIKTAGNWEAWHKEPRNFTRFLVSNLINLGIAYFITLRWITRAP